MLRSCAVAASHSCNCKYVSTAAHLSRKSSSTANNLTMRRNTANALPARSANIPNPSPSDRGHNRSRECGRSRGRGRGRGGAPELRKMVNNADQVGSSSATGTPQNERRERAPKPRLTHFIAIPLGHNAAFRQTVSTFTNALLANAPAISGLDPSIVIPARRMHFTLGVMSLDLDDPDPEGADSQTTPSRLPRTLEAAAKLLQDLKPRVMELLGKEKLRVTLDSMDIMPPERRDRERANVMWVGPAGGRGSEMLRAVANLVQKTFKQAGLLVDESRPLKLHCTVLNTIYRKPRPQTRMPFSYPSVLASGALKSVLVCSGIQEDASEHNRAQKGPIKVNFGKWDVDEIQICEMGSWGPEGEYVCVARCALK